jgi:hypothetical protein
MIEHMRTELAFFYFHGAAAILFHQKEVPGSSTSLTTRHQSEASEYTVEAIYAISMS